MASPTIAPISLDTSPYFYYAQAGDTLSALAIRFDVRPEEITSPDPIPPTGLIPPGQVLIIPRNLFNTISPQHILPDSELVFSASHAYFDVHTYIQNAGGYLSTYREYLVSTGMTTGADVVMRQAIENSINPRLLLALLEYRAGWVFGQPANEQQRLYPLGYVENYRDGLYQQLSKTIDDMSLGYYGWRNGNFTTLTFTDGGRARLAPDLNAGSVGLMYYFASHNDSENWLQVTNIQTGFPAVYERMFGSPWERAATVEPLYPRSIFQPEMILPFARGQQWVFTSGPHGAWNIKGALAALDFAPSEDEPGCSPSLKWVTASAPGLVVRSGNGVLVLDLDGDGLEQTGWALVYLHLSSEQRLPVGQWVATGDLIGHPSCEGGRATGRHIHLARKYNGEWVLAAGPLPFTLSGWVAGPGPEPYEGTLTRDGVTIKNSVYGSSSAALIRSANDP
jgi:murein DD-endopeptidase MepM/ murein hydrolase activator NlpD